MARNDDNVQGVFLAPPRARLRTVSATGRNEIGNGKRPIAWDEQDPAPGPIVGPAAIKPTKNM